MESWKEVAEVVDPVDLSLYPCPVPAKEVVRSAILDTIDLKFERGEQVVVISGAEGMGKTVLLGQFVKRHKKRCIALFINVVNRNSYAEESLFIDIYRQVYFYINDSDPEVGDEVDVKRLSSLFYRLNMLLSKEKEKLFIVVDGLAGIPETDRYAVESIMDVLPLSYSSICFMFSDIEGTLTKHLPKKQISVVEMVVFSEAETTALLPGLSSEQVKYANKIFRGIPETLETFRRLLDAGASAEEIFDGHSSSAAASSLYDAEWERQRFKIEACRELLGIACHSVNSVTLSTAARMVDITEQEACESLDGISFVEVVDGIIKFASDGVKSYCQGRLEDIEKESISKIVLSFSDKPTAQNITALSAYYQKLGDSQSIISQLTNNNISLLYKSGRSVNQAIRQVRIGRSAAVSSDLEEEVLRMAQVESMLVGLRTPPHLRSRLDSYLEEGDYESALGLVSSAPIVEEQLQLLAIIAGYQKRNEGKVEVDIEERVKSTFSDIRPEHLGVERAIDLARALFSAFPDLSMSIIKNIDGMDGSGGNKSDYAFYKLSMEAIKKDGGSVAQLLDHTVGMEEKKRNALSILEVFKPGTPVSKIVSKVESLEDPSDSIYILRSWISAYPETEGVNVLCDKILSLVVTSSDFHANASLYADVTTALRTMSPREGEPIRERVYSQIESLAKAGPSIDYARLLANIIVYENANRMRSDSISRLKSYVDEVSDSATKLSIITLLGGDQAYEYINKEIFGLADIKAAAFESVVGEAADQFDIVKDALLREAAVSLNNGLAWAKRLNTRQRRDLAVAVVLKQAFDTGQEVSIDKACQEIRRIKSKNYQSSVVVSLFDMASKINEVSKSDAKKLVKLRNKINNNFALCKINCHLIDILTKVHGEKSAQVMHAVEALENSWKSIDGDWLKIDKAYQIHKRLYTIDSELSKRYRDSAVEISRNKLSESGDLVESLVFVTDLAIRAFYFMCDKDIQRDEDFDRVIRAIKKIPAKIPKIKQLSRLASALYVTKKQKEFEMLVEKELLPTLESVGDQYSKELAVVLFWAGPIIFVYDRGTFEDKLDLVREDEALCDDVLRATQKFILNRCLLGDPFDPVKNYKYKISPKDLEGHIYLLRNVKEDGKAFFGCSVIVDTVVRGVKNNLYTQTQLNSLRSLIDGFAVHGFDSSEFIAHDGYKICFSALSMKMANNKTEGEWLKLIERVDGIPVKSDQIFTLGEVIEAMPNSLRELKRSTLRRAVDLTDQLSSGLDKLSRYDYLVNVGMKVDVSYVKKFVKKAILISAAENTEEYEERRKNLIDSVFSMDKDFAAGLSALFDRDPARKAVIQKNIEKKRAEKKEREDFDINSEDIKKEALTGKYSELTWSLLGRLNADNHVPSKNDRRIGFLVSASQYGMIDAYPLFSYYIHSQGQACVSKGQAVKHLPPLFNSSMECAELVFSLCSTDEVSDSVAVTDRQIVFEESEREKAEEFMRRWVQELENPAIAVVDPYFCVEDLGLIGAIISKDPEFSVKILTSFSNISKIASDSGSDVGDVVRRYWEENVCSDAMPYISLMFCGVPSLNNQMPIHDRWVMGQGSALRLGGSLNGVGGRRISSISKMNKEDVLALEKRIGGFLDGSKKQYKQERVRYQYVSI